MLQGVVTIVGLVLTTVGTIWIYRLMGQQMHNPAYDIAMKEREELVQGDYKHKIVNPDYWGDTFVWWIRHLITLLRLRQTWAVASLLFGLWMLLISRVMA